MMGAVAEIFIYRNIAETVTDTYLGHIVGEQILGGQIKRGDGAGDQRRAVVLRPARLHRPQRAHGAPDLLELLNNYLQLVGDALKAKAARS